MPAVREPAATNVTSTPASQPTPAPDHSEYMAKVRAAVQQAFVYPAAASSLGLHGRVKVRFRLTQKTPANAQVVTSSGVSMIDRAAISSVLAARYPEPAADMNLNQMEFEIWIEYRPS
jgi:TonB family protein